MGIRINVSCTISYVLLDLIIATVLYAHGSHLNIFVEESLSFSILQSTLDIWGTALLRASLLLGASIGVLWNREDGPHRVTKLNTLILLVCQTIITYTLAKLLMLSELEPLSHRPWSLSLICWTCFSSLAILVLWWVLGKENSNSHKPRYCEDTEKLLQPDCEEDEEKEGCSERENNSEKKERAKTTTGATLGRLLRYTKEDGGLLTVAVIFLIISAVCEAFIPYYYGKAIDSIVVHQSMEYFAKPAITLTVLAFTSSIAIGVRGGVFTLTFARLNLRFRNHLFRTLMKQDIGFFDENHTGDITSRLSADTTQVSDLISQNINVFLRSAIKAVGFLIFMFGMSWKLTLVNMMGLPFIGLLSEYYGNYYKKLTKEVQTTLAKANKVAEETISAMKTVRSFANEHREADSYYDKLVVMYHLNKKQALAYACYMWSSCNIASVYSGLMQGVGAAEKVFEYLDRKPDHPADGTETLETFTGLVEFQDIKFSYPTRPEIEILQGVSFSLKPGEVTALVGPSGSGKSSCVNLLENFYVPQQGQVLLDGKPVHTIEHGDLHFQVALVGQEPVLFARTIEENITYGLTDVPIEAVIQAATKANAHDFIIDLPQGYQTSVGEKGAQLSGGQKQRVAIARALVRHPRVLILDEATSALDAESEHIVQQALNNIMREHTVLVVAHRLSTVERADSIIVIDKGRVAEQGSHGQLMASGGLYYKLVQRQVLGIETGDEVLNLSENSSWKPDGGHHHNRQSSSASDEEYNPRY
ncbi:ABC-type oligopeptide transporter ABCB9 isoform X2 [Vanacampus margaritifer]